jgi:2-dehydropantoate 2-reductase
VRYIVIGAGAIGGAIGGRLFESGHEVVLVARGPHLGALRAHGLRLATPAGTSTLRIPAVGGPGELELRDGDALLLAVKTQDAEAALAEWAWQPVRGGTVAADSLPVVCAQNGVASERFALRRFRRVYGMCVWLPATYLEPGTVEAQGAPLAGLLHIGRYPSGTDAIATRIGGDLAGGGFLAPVTAEVMRWKYGKLRAHHRLTDLRTGLHPARVMPPRIMRKPRCPAEVSSHKASPRAVSRGGQGACAVRGSGLPTR